MRSYPEDIDEHGQWFRVQSGYVLRQRRALFSRHVENPPLGESLLAISRSAAAQIAVHRAVVCVLTVAGG
jgi:hypothetical protein